MSFLSPWLLLGLLAAIIPPLLHLLNRKEPIPLVFPAMEFLRRAYRKTARRMKIKQWLLIAIRSLLLIFFALALSRPYWQDHATPLSNGTQTQHAAGAHVFVIDLSYAMDYQIGDRTLLAIARDHILGLLDEVKGPVGIVLAGEHAEAPLASLSADYMNIRNVLSQLKTIAMQSRLDESIALALQLLQERPISEVKSISVLSNRGLQALGTVQIPDTLGKVLLDAVTLDVKGLQSLGLTEKDSLDNHAILNVAVQPAPQMGIGQWRVDVDVANYSAKPMHLWPISVEVNQEIKVRGFLNLVAGATGKKRFYFKLDPQALDTKKKTTKIELSTVLNDQQGLRGWVRLAKDDLKIDDSFPFWIEPNPPIRILALNGDPRPTPQEDELFYLSKALSVEITGGERFQLITKPLESDDFNAEDLGGVDVVLLANLPYPSQALADVLIPFVKQGGGLWLAPGARTNVAQWNRVFNKILPRPLRAMRRAGDAAAGIQDRQVARLSEFESHAILEPFKDPMRSALPQINIWTYMLFDPQPNEKSEVIMTLNEGSPFMISRQIDRGRVLLMGGPVDREWSDWVIQADFVPLSHQIVRYLTQSVSMNNQQVLYAKPLILDLNGEGPFYSLSPMGEKVILQRKADHGFMPSLWQVDQTRPLGHHRIIQRDQKVLSRFVVNLDAQGSNLREYLLDDKQTNSSQKSQVTQSTLNQGKRQELWHIALFTLFIILLLEGLLLYKSRQVGVST
jgi:hypothetical protein